MPRPCPAPWWIRCLTYWELFAATAVGYWTHRLRIVSSRSWSGERMRRGLNCLTFNCAVPPWKTSLSNSQATPGLANASGDGPHDGASGIERMDTAPPAHDPSEFPQLAGDRVLVSGAHHLSSRIR